MAKAKRISGGAAIKASGRKPILAGFEPADHDKIRQAAAIERRSMTQFFVHHTIAAAEKILKKSSELS